MRILIEGENLEDYLAKCHEAFRTGLRALYDARPFGRNYPGFMPFFSSYGAIAKWMFPDFPPDLLLLEVNLPVKTPPLNYRGLDELEGVHKATILADYWEIADKHFDAYVQLISDSRIDFIFTYFPQPLAIWKDTALGERMIYNPPCFDPRLFNDWQLEKTHDVGFLAAGTTQLSPFYEERFAIHKLLLAQLGPRYLWAQHPGWQRRKQHPLIGRGFSETINRCKLFVTTGGKLRNAHAKYVEILASGSLLLADEPLGAERLGLIDGVNYVKIAAADVLDKVAYYLQHDDEREEIARNGHRLALTRHNCYQRAVEVISEFESKRSQQR